jgi:histidyl-tRNA synthetase
MRDFSLVCLSPYPASRILHSSMPDRIQPRTLKGFRDYLPQTMLPREQIMDTARRVFRSYGFSPIDTPALEYLDILLGKGGAETDKQLYRFKDHGDRDVGLRFDLTVPLARFAAQHIAELGTPFKRYHIATVWRGENTQRGRYREFMQCDFDTIGTQSVAADAETVLIAHDLLRAIGFERFTIRINNRLVLNGLLESLHLEEKSTHILRALDKLTKIGRDKVCDEIQHTTAATADQANRVVELVQLTGSNDEKLAQLRPLVAGSERGSKGIDQLTQVWNTARAAGVAAERLRIDVSIARGLDYYTGTVLETTLDDDPDNGSVCSGGRYDNLAELYTNQRLPGIGASLGLDRLLDSMQKLGMLEANQRPAQVFIPFFDPAHLGDYFKLAAALRAAGLAVEVYPESTKLGKQLQYADRKKFRVALIAGDREFAANECQVKDLSSSQSTTVPLADNATALIAEVRRILAN